MRIVIDTMVFISGAQISNSPSSMIMQLWEQGKVQIAASDSILLELEQVLKYPAIRRFLPMSDSQIARYIKKIRQGAYMVSGTMPIDISSDPKDNKFFACAIEAQAQYLVSKDKRHVLAVGSYKEVQTITPQDFIEKVVKLERAA